MKNILVTGGFGFIGSHLVDRLLAGRGALVHVVDDLSTSPINLEDYLKGVRDRDLLTYDICTVEKYFSGLELPKYDQIYHLAAVVGPVGVLKHSGEILRRTVVDTYAVSDYASRVGARVCNISTSEVYGGGRDGYCSERDSMIIPPKTSVRLEYAVAKLSCEVALINQARCGRLHATVVRPFNVAGPRQATLGGFVLPRFIEQALANKPITVYGDGKMVRAFTHVADIADGIIRTMNSGMSGEAYNMGNPANKTTIIELAHAVLRVVSTKSFIDFVDPKALWGDLFEEANDKYPDADRAFNELGWRPRYGLEETIHETFEYMRAGRRD